MTKTTFPLSMIVILALFGACSPRVWSDQVAMAVAVVDARASHDRAVVIAPTVASRRSEEARVNRILRDLRRTTAQRQAKRRRTGDDPNANAPTALAARFVPKRPVTLGRLSIPAIDLDAAFANGVHDDVLKRGPGHWPGTPLPGGLGNAVLSGHRTTFTHPFRDLDRLRAGDAIRVRVGRRTPVAYRVRGVHVVPESQYVKFVLRRPQSPRARLLTLFACHPKGFRTHRIVVRAAAKPLPAPITARQGGPTD